MADDDSKREYHLTLRGWVRGTSRYFNHVQGAERPRPNDAVATFEDRTYQRSMWSQSEYSFNEVWRSKRTSDDQLQELLRKFKRPDEGGKVLEE